MAITYPLTAPSVLTDNIVSASITGSNVVSINESPFTFSQQTYEFQGKRWEGSLTTAPLSVADAQAVQAFLFELNGIRGTFTMDIGAALGEPWRGSIATPGSITVDTGFNAGDQSISLAVGSSFVLREGDWFTLTGATTGIPRLHKALNVPIASAYDLNIWPGLRDDPDDETLTMTDEGKGIFRLASNDIRWSKGVNNLTSLSFDFVEAL